MNKLETCLAGKVYTIRKQYPVIQEFGRRIREVERELNKDRMENCSSCKYKRRCSCKNGCKNRQKY